jgi:Putative zinc-finger
MRSPACQRFRALAALSVDAEPSELDALALEQHLERCPACRSFAGMVGSFTRELRGAEPEPFQVRLPPMRRRRGLDGLLSQTVAFAAVAAVAVFVTAKVDDVVSRPEVPRALPALVIDASGADTLRETQTFLHGLRDASLVRTFGGPERAAPTRPGLQVG